MTKEKNIERDEEEKNRGSKRLKLDQNALLCCGAETGIKEEEKGEGARKEGR